MSVKVGVIGCGSISRFHLEGYLAAGAEIVKICDANADLAHQSAEKYGTDWSTDYTDILADGSIDAVSICLPNHFHFSASANALAAGKHVLCEKTMTTNLEDARELVKLVKSSGKLFQIAYMKRFLPAVQLAKEYTQRIGTPLTGSIKVYHPCPDFYWDADSWSLKKEITGGISLVHSGSHILDLMCFLYGDPISVDARTRYRPGKDQDYFTHAYFEMENGSTVSFECAWLQLNNIGFRSNGWDERIELTGDKGRIELLTTWWDRPDDDSPVLRAWLEGEGPMQELCPPNVNAFTEEVKAFMGSIGSGEPTSPDVIDGYFVQLLIDAIYRSAAEHRPIEIRSEF